MQRRSSLQRLIERNIVPDTLTDQTSAHDPLIGYIPHTLTNEQANILRTENPTEYLNRAYESMYLHVQLMLQLMDKGAITFDYGNNIRARAQEFEQKAESQTPNALSVKPSALGRCFDFPGFVPAYIRPLFCEGKGPFRWAALSGDPNDIAVTDEVIMNMFPHNKGMIRWMKMAKQKLLSRDCPPVSAGWDRAKEKKQVLPLMN